MKKIAFMFVAAMAMTFAACGGAATENAENADSAAADTLQGEAVEAVEEAVEEVADSAAVEAVEAVEEAVEAPADAQ